MATIINNPSDAGRINRVERVERTESSGTGFLVGVILAILLGILLLAYGLPNFRRASNVNVPDTINVDVNGGSTGGGTNGGTSTPTTPSY
jgi:hypothetical protein